MDKHISKHLFDFFETTPLWTGLAKEKLVAYYHLLLQYHGQLIGETVPSRGRIATVKNMGNNVAKVEKALKDLLDRISTFTDNSESYKKMESIWHGFFKRWINMF